MRIVQWHTKFQQVHSDTETTVLHILL